MGKSVKNTKAETEIVNHLDCAFAEIQRYINTLGDLNELKKERMIVLCMKTNDALVGIVRGEE